MRTLPVFIHIPKCAGVYVKGAMLALLRYYAWHIYRRIPKYICGYIEIGKVYEAPKVSELMTEVDGATMKFTQLTPSATDMVAFVVFKSQIPEWARVHECHFALTPEEFLTMLKDGAIDVFAAMVTSEMWEHNSFWLLEEFRKLCPKPVSFFTSLKPPFERALSMYYVNKQHGANIPSFNLPFNEFSKEEFTKFLLSNDSEPGWISQFLLQLFGDDLSLVDITAAPIQDVNYLLNSVFSKAYSEVVLPPELCLTESGVAGFPRSNVTDKKHVFSQSDLSEKELSDYQNLHSPDIAVIDFLLGASCCPTK